MNNIQRYIVRNEDQVPASYSAELGAQTALAYALQNVRTHGGKLFAQDFNNEETELNVPSRRR